MTTPPNAHWGDPHESDPSGGSRAGIPVIVGVLGLIALALLSFTVYFLFFTGGSPERYASVAQTSNRGTSTSTTTVTSTTASTTSTVPTPTAPTGATQPTGSTLPTIQNTTTSSTATSHTTVAQSSSSTTTTTEPTSTEPEPTPPNTSQVAPGIPGGARAVNESALNGEPSGSYNNVYLSGATSDDFAMNVHEAYMDSYRSTGQTSGQVRAYSPTTHRYYEMNCRDQGNYVHCTGGDGANVYIS